MQWQCHIFKVLKYEESTIQLCLIAEKEGGIYPDHGRGVGDFAQRKGGLVKRAPPLGGAGMRLDRELVRAGYAWWYRRRQAHPANLFKKISNTFLC